MSHPEPRLLRVKELALQGLSIAKDCRAHADAKGQVRLSLAGLAPLLTAWLKGDRAQVRAELEAQLQVLENAFRKNGGWSSKRAVDACDGLGHVRPVYGTLYAHALLRALAWAHPVTAETVCEHNEAAEVGEQLMELLCGTKIGSWRNGTEEDVAMVPWLNVLTADQAVALAQPLTHQVANCLEAVLPADAKGGALHEQGMGDTQDTWVYRELTTLHALAELMALTGDPALARRVQAACAYHLAHTQTDYTTYQPWGLPAFLGSSGHAMADQQLHDVAAHFAIEGASGAAVPAVLLALVSGK